MAQLGRGFRLRSGWAWKRHANLLGLNILREEVRLPKDEHALFFEWWQLDRAIVTLQKTLADTTLSSSAKIKVLASFSKTLQDLSLDSSFSVFTNSNYSLQKTLQDVQLTGKIDTKIILQLNVVLEDLKLLAKVSGALKVTHGFAKIGDSLYGSDTINDILYGSAVINDT